jgi:Transglutaminase-like superfamily
MARIGTSGGWRAVLGVAALLVAGGGEPRAMSAPPMLPAPLATLQQELWRFGLCVDEITADGADWWGFWWSLPERGCGDCEDFAAYAYARLRELGVPAGNIRVMAAELGEQVQADGREALVLHVWLEAELAGGTWTVWNRQIREGVWCKARRMLSPAETEALIEAGFGPNWPYGIEAD